MARARLLVRRELGVDIGRLPYDAAARHVAEAEALREMRIEEDAAAVTRGIVAAFGGS